MTTAFANMLASRIVQEHAAVVDALPAQIAGREQRRDALHRFTEQGIPGVRDENWRYANLHTLEHMQFAPAVHAFKPVIPAAAIPQAISGYRRYIFADGRFSPELSNAPMNGFSAGAPLSSDGRPVLADERMALLNEAFATDNARIVATGSQEPLCIEVVFIAGADPESRASYPRLDIQAQAGSRVAIIERHLSVGHPTQFVNGAVAVDIAQGASVDHYRLQHTGRETTWMDTLSARLATDASYRLHIANLGAQSARSTVQVALEGERAAVTLNAVSVPDRFQVHDIFAVIEHSAPGTTTEERFRGIAAEEARVGFNGKMVVREAARGTVSRQSLRGLLAGPKAEVDVRPQLEIYTDDVQCSHGATAGKLDDTMLFYLLSRGLERDTAQLLLKWAFLEDVVSKIDLPDLRKQIEQTLAAQMNAAALREMI